MAFSRLRCLLKPLACALLASVAALSPAPASAASPFLMTPEASIAEASPAYRYANMTNDEALAELDRRRILYLKVDHAPGVRAPIRLTGRLNGVHFHSVLPPEQRVTSVFEILDARLALALDDFAALLARHDIDEVVHYTMYRPNMPVPGRGGAGEQGGHEHAAAPAKAAGSAARKGSPRPAPAVGLGEKGTLDATSKAHEEPPRAAPAVDLGEKGAPDAAPNEPVESPRPAPAVDLGEKGTLDAASKAPEERPRPLKEKGAAETVAKKGAAKDKGGAEAAPKEKGAAKGAPKEKGAAKGAPKEKGAAEAVAKKDVAGAVAKKGAAAAAPKEKGAAEAVAKKDVAGAVAKKGAAAAAPKEKGGAGAAPKDKGTTAAAPKEKGAAEPARSAAPSAAGDRPQATAARSGPAKQAGKAGRRRVALREPVGSTRATASSTRHRGEVTLRSGEGQKPRGKWAPPGTRHPAGLAIDVGALRKRDGTWMSVARHFHGRIGDKTCGGGAPQPELPEARELRSIVCEAADLGIFTYVLTPNYDAPHADHFHMEIKPGVRWFLYH
ncbi:extensin family protein [Sorangium sp. So ce1097]|uniref:extensin family protein n=1 Tax=Sorangium sp. So ce1097 TaxID=3133330 RepID=UPI003F5FB525